MDFKTTCMFCGNSYSSSDYCCNCKEESWAKRYRSLDIEIDASRYKAAAAASFADYDFQDDRGMLQYQLLPNRSRKSDKTVGLTPLHYLSNFNNAEGHVFMKDEGQNPSGCFKDRESMMCLLHSKEEGLKNIVIYSSGNAAASAALMVENSSRQLITFVPGDTYPEKIEYIRNHGSDVIKIGDENATFEEGYRLFSEINAQKIFIDTNFDNWSVRNPYRVQGDKTIAVEIVKQLSPGKDKTVVPDYVVVPTANGSCLTGIWKGFKELFEAGIIDTLPKLISAGIKNASPVYKAVQQNETEKPARCDLSNMDKDDAEVGSIILAEEGYDSIEAANAVIESGGAAVELHASDIKQALINFLEKESELALKNNILPEPASLTSLAALKKVKKPESDQDIFVAISTGHGLKAQQKIEELLVEKPQLQLQVEEIIAKGEENSDYANDKNGRIAAAGANLDSILESFFKLQKSFNYEYCLQTV